MKILFKRIYDEPAKEDGFRILADRLWPRGMAKEKAQIDLWAKDIAPTHELRKSYHAGDLSFSAFESRYTEELNANPQADDFLKMLKAYPTITLLTAAKDISKAALPALSDFISNRTKATE
ncbi:DUF488 domain-containing protein [Chryseobacterium sp. MFBS3-17]|uniref:DUF488 domain-containing protein n=1 Tax=Chryseobacterium sp. MFBS3-17 TaxID=2886689 RepID=UPI001D0DCB7E|nr:DUF488 family protein [Chryseobacterium sp. MFBS3-17]MCC2589871.1 DUF488 family protein [Chryseobacterium sp. MFBS3-17]